MPVQCLLKCGVCLLGLMTGSFAWAKQIALTFDDAPMPSSQIRSGQARTDLLLRNLKQAGVGDALFFVTTQHAADATSKQRIAQYIAQGFHIAHHSHAHQSANKLSVSEYLQDFDQADSVLKHFEHYLRFHRFPFLHYGETLASQQQLRSALVARGFKDGYVTVDNAEWYLNHLYQQAIENGQAVDTEALRRLYIETLMAGIAYYDALALKTLDRSPRHVLLLHANDISAMFVGDLVLALRNAGWEIISPQKAYQDPIANSTPKTTYLKQGRVAALAHDAGTPESELKSPVENLDFLKEKFATVVTASTEPARRVTP